MYPPGLRARLCQVEEVLDLEVDLAESKFGSFCQDEAEKEDLCGGDKKPRAAAQTATNMIEPERWTRSPVPGVEEISSARKERGKRRIKRKERPY